MARLYPDLNKILNTKPYPEPGEKYILEYLKDILDDNFEIYFQPFLNGEKPDIVIVKKGSGAVIIEVKDWDLNCYNYYDESCFIIKNSTQKVRSPFEQVKYYKDNLYNLYIESLLNKKIINKKCYAAVSCLVYFHNASIGKVRSFMGNDYFKEIKYCDILTNDTLTKENVNRILRKRGMYSKSKFFDDDIYIEIKRKLSPSYHKYDDGKSIYYTSKQKELIVSKAGSQKIKGAAGCGKTLIMAKRAVNAHIRTGGEVLILTYNITLRNYIRDMISQVRENFNWNNFVICNYHQFILNEINKYGIYKKKHYDSFEEMDKDIFSNVNLFKGINIMDKYDAIFIDEIQDYKKEWMDILKNKFLNDNGEYVVFGDEKQNVYRREIENKKPKTNIKGSWKILNESFRMGSKLSAFALKFQNYYFANKYDVDNIVCVNTSFFDNESHIEYMYVEDDSYNKICEKVYNMMKKNNINSNDLCIVGTEIVLLRKIDYIFNHYYHEKTSTMFETEEQYNKLKKEDRLKEVINIRRNKKYNFWMNSGLIKICTVHSFKGWEIKNLVLVIDKDEKEIDELIYTGCTRSIKNLLIINMGNEHYHEFFKEAV